MTDTSILGEEDRTAVKVKINDKKDKPKFTMADVEKSRFYRKIQKGRQYVTPSVNQLFSMCKTETDVDELMAEALARLKPSTGTLKKWKKMAKARKLQISRVRYESMLSQGIVGGGQPMQSADDAKIIKG